MKIKGIKISENNWIEGELWLVDLDFFQAYNDDGFKCFTNGIICSSGHSNAFKIHPTSIADTNEINILKNIVKHNDKYYLKNYRILEIYWGYLMTINQDLKEKDYIKNRKEIKDLIYKWYKENK